MHTLVRTIHTLDYISLCILFLARSTLLVLALIPMRTRTIPTMRSRM